MLSFRFDGGLVLRFAERTFLGALFQLPPRSTRFEPPLQRSGSQMLNQECESSAFACVCPCEAFSEPGKHTGAVTRLAGRFACHNPRKQSFRTPGISAYSGKNTADAR